MQVLIVLVLVVLVMVVEVVVLVEEVVCLVHVCPRSMMLRSRSAHQPASKQALDQVGGWPGLAWQTCTGGGAAVGR